MKIPYLQLAQLVNKKLPAVCIISGEDLFLMQEAIDLIRSCAMKSGYTERVIVTLDTLITETQRFSLFATKRLLEMDLTAVKLSAATSKILQQYANHLSDDIVLLIRMHKLDSKTEQSAWYKALAKIAMICPIWPISITQLPQWICERAKKIGLTITTSAANLLAYRVEGNLLAAAQELEKLGLLHLNTTITDTMIAETVTDLAQFDLFNLVDATLVGDKTRSLRILQHLQASDEEPILVLWALSRELRTLWSIKQQIQRGASLSSLFPKFRIFEKRQPLVRAFLQRQPISQLLNLLAQGAEIDRLLKGAEPGNKWNELERWVVQW